ncbi:MAG: transposase [Oscillospiraceae bacterium]|nr:transposase [Oscillospiraceae bacterium]
MRSEEKTISGSVDPPSRKKGTIEDKDYSRNGAFFVTICTKDRTEFFGKIHDDQMILSELGTIAEEFANKIEDIYDSVLLDAFILMPNHVHLLIVLLSERNNPEIQRIINQYKGAVSKKAGFPLWQNRYHSHVIYSGSEYRRIRRYINTNPKRWGNDCIKNGHWPNS